MVLVGVMSAQSPQPAGARGTAQRVAPGNTHTNADGVTVDNRASSHGNATIDPRTGSGSSTTTVRTKTGFDGKVSGIDSNDDVSIGSSSQAEVEGEGGSVRVGGGSTVKVTNGGSAGNITVNLPSGTVLTVPPGQHVIVTT